MAFSLSNIGCDAKSLERRTTAAWLAWLVRVFTLAFAVVAAVAVAGAQSGGNGATEPTKSTLCEFFSGPRKGSRGIVFPARPIGAACHDDAGNNGVTVSPVKTLPGPIVVPHRDQGPPVAPPPAARPMPQQGAAVPQPAAPQPAPQSPQDGRKTYEAPHHHQPAAPGGAPPPAGVAGDLDGGREQAAYGSMEQQARSGTMPYDVPKQMTVGEAVTVRVDLLGSKADPATANFAPSGVVPLKVSPLMEVTLSEPLNPDAFTIVADPVQSGTQIVPVDGKAEWAWKVTPKQGGNSPQVLQIDAYMMLNEKSPDGEFLRSAPILSATVPVPVSVRGFWPRAGDFLQNNWATLVGYILPSGAGATLLIFLFNRRKAKAEGV